MQTSLIKLHFFPHHIIRASSQSHDLRLSLQFWQLSQDGERDVNKLFGQAKLIFYEIFFVVFLVGTVFNVTLKLPNATYDESLANPHSPQFIKLRTDFEVGVSFVAVAERDLEM